MKALARLCCCANWRQVAVAGDAQHLEAFLLDRLRERADAEARGVLGAEVLVDDDDRESGISWQGSGQQGDKQAHVNAAR